ncbi:class I SAM-dependent methyltransferase [Alkaliphilus transvaalensis]|uniref:class I SAM-dependent methyltransferase n=1 Tax=Alkaliphilus transvaalensis TaxID=114628 RepID=UPI001FA70BEE|nr:class I SAM-dependent methyltransferase [Alkaliphilus transvaalensis]
MQKAKSRELNIELEEYIQGNALELSEYEEKYDVILLMGPLYHLIKEDDRRMALKNALDLLKSGGIIFVAFISKYAPIQDSLAHLYDINDPQSLLKYLKDGENKEGEGFTSAYFTSPEEVNNLMSDFDIHELAFVGVENILGCKEKEICSLDEEQYHKWLEIGYQLSADKNLMGTSQHFLYIGKKK